MPRPVARFLVLLAVLSCTPSGARPLKPVNVGHPPAGRGLGTLVVSPEGRVFVGGDRGLWEVTGSLEGDTLVWKQRTDVPAADAVSWAPGLGLVARQSAGLAVVTDAGATLVPTFEDRSVQPLLALADGTQLGAPYNAPGLLLRRAAGNDAWSAIPGSAPSTGMGSGRASAVVHPNGTVYALNGSRVLSLPADLSAATVLFDCDTRELGSCGGSSTVVLHGLTLAADGRMTFAIHHDEAELYAFAPSDARLAKRAFYRASGDLPAYFQGPQAFAASGEGDAFLLMRTEQVGGEVHVLAHRAGAGTQEWVTVATGLPRVMNVQVSEAGEVWLWDHSDAGTGLWKLVDPGAQCPKCVAAGAEEP